MIRHSYLWQSAYCSLHGEWSFFAIRVRGWDEDFARPGKWVKGE